MLAAIFTLKINAIICFSPSKTECAQWQASGEPAPRCLIHAYTCLTHHYYAPYAPLSS